MKRPLQVGDKVRVTGYALDIAEGDIGMPVTHRWDAVVVSINEPLIQVKVLSSGSGWEGCVVEVYPCQCQRLIKKKKDWVKGAARGWISVPPNQNDQVVAGYATRMTEAIELTLLVRKRLGIE